MANLINTVDWLTLESLRSLVNSLKFASRMNYSYSKEYERPFPVGETIRIKLPQRWVPTSGIQYNPQPISRQYTTATMNQFIGVHFDYDSIESALKLERTPQMIFDQYFRKAIEELAQEIDSRAVNFATQNTNHITGVLGTTPTTVTPFHQARQKIVENAGETGKLTTIVHPKVNASLASNLTNLFHPGDEISRLFKRGYLGQLADAEWFESMSLYSLTAGTWQTPANVKVSGASQSGSSITIADTSGDTFNVGDIITFASVNEVNPKTRRSTGSLKQFVITQALTGTGSDTIQISPPIIGPNPDGSLAQYQNVDSLPANNAVLTLYPGTTSPNGLSGVQNLYFTEDAFAFVSVPLELPKAVEYSSEKRDEETGIAIRIVKMFDPILSRMICRLDTLFGFGLLYPDNCACRIASA